jgi:hypothetical protein
MPKITAYPVGNADTLRLDLRDGRKVLVDYADERNSDDPKDKRTDLPAELRADLKAAGTDTYDVAAFTHLDKDHVRGASEFFSLDHAQKYQGAERTKIGELWVPAGALTEVNSEDCARAIRQEARHRLREGYGIRVFSRPDALKWWFEQEKLDMASRRHLITDAGELVPGFSKHDAGGVEFFIHSPFGWRRDEREVEDRNQDSLVFQATFREGGQDTRVLFNADMDWPGLNDIVDITRKYGNAHRLHWDVMKLPHHCSYLSLSGEKGTDETTPTDQVRWLYEEAGQPGGILLSSSWPIPLEGTNEDKDKQPPHRQAANYYRDVRAMKGGEFEVTMERPAIRPKPTVIEITRQGARLLPSMVAPAAAIAATPMRAG